MGFALVVVEEHARRTVHLRNDDALGAVDDEGAIRRHERHIAHVNVLLLDVLDRLCAGVDIDIKHDEAQRHLERGSVGHTALAALIRVVFRRLERVLHKFKKRGAGKITNGEYRLKYCLKAVLDPATDRFLNLEKLVIGGLLNLNEVRHNRYFADMPEELAHTLPSGEGLSHFVPRFYGIPPAPRTSFRRDRQRPIPLTKKINILTADNDGPLKAFVDNDTVPGEKSPRDRIFQRSWVKANRRMADRLSTKSPIT